MQTFKFSTGIAAALAMAVQTMPAAAAPLPGSVRDLVGVKAVSGEEEMSRRGFKQVHSDNSGSRKYGTWWNENTSECIVVTTYDGRYEALAVTQHEDCKKKGDGGKTAAIAIGAAALIGALAIAGSGHKDKDEKYQREYDRGYRDGYDGRRYDNWNNTSGYTDGYNEGRRQSNRPGGNWGGNWGGNGGSWNNGNGWVNMGYLVGQPMGRAWRDLDNRGFRVRDDKWNRGERYATFWRSRSNQCIIVRANYDRVNSVENTSPRTCDR